MTQLAIEKQRLLALLHTQQQQFNNLGDQMTKLGKTNSQLKADIVALAHSTGEKTRKEQQLCKELLHLQANADDVASKLANVNSEKQQNTLST